MLNREGEEQQLTTYRPRHQLTLYEPDQDGEWWKAEAISWDPGKTVRRFYVPKDIGQSLLDELTGIDDIGNVVADVVDQELESRQEERPA